MLGKGSRVTQASELCKKWPSLHVLCVWIQALLTGSYIHRSLTAMVEYVGSEELVSHKWK